MRSTCSRWLLLTWILWWAPYPSVTPALSTTLPPEKYGCQDAGHRLALKAPGDSGAGLVEEEQPKKAAPKQPDEEVAPGETEPPPLESYQPSESIPADQAVDFPADI
jgi:hypothetical protein